MSNTNQTLSEITTIDELKEFVGDDDLTEEEWVDLINYVLNKRFHRPNKTDNS